MVLIIIDMFKRSYFYRFWAYNVLLLLLENIYLFMIKHFNFHITQIHFVDKLWVAQFGCMNFRFVYDYWKMCTLFYQNA